VNRELMIAILFGADDGSIWLSKPALLDTSSRHLLAFELRPSWPYLVHVFSRDFKWAYRSWVSLVLYYIIFHVAYLSITLDFLKCAPPGLHAEREINVH
jgi:hypothetical protein